MRMRVVVQPVRGERGMLSAMADAASSASSQRSRVEWGGDGWVGEETVAVEERSPNASA